MGIEINHNFENPEERYLEIVERKGIGHPDTLADKLAEECSRVYSKYCMDNFGCVLHHNIDKLYIGAGLFKYENNEIKMYEPIKIEINGRCSNTMNGEKINLEEIFIPVIKRYLKSVMPKLNIERGLNINVNCTQNTKRDYWYNPRNIEDVPDAKSVTAGDTALCVSHGGLTYCERVAIELERSLYRYNEYGYSEPIYKDIGQDIKIMVVRRNKEVDINMCIPVLKGNYETEEQYDEIIKKYYIILEKNLKNIDNPKKYKTNLFINYKDDGTIDKYALCIGTCAECGEEGVVGRGNNTQGIIPTFRAHSVEAACGKNVRYHTGRALAYMINNASTRIYNELGIMCSIYALTRNRNSLLNPYILEVMLENKEVDEEKVRKIINEELNEKYIERILKQKNLY